jgi:D-glycero-D-manno-heptose 1,7-bisphosphate phosphatase
MRQRVTRGQKFRRFTNPLLFYIPRFSAHAIANPQSPLMTAPDSLYAGTVVDGEGIWVRILSPPQPSWSRAALFLDRDGVVVEEVRHLCRAQDVRLVTGAASMIARANRVGIPVVVATNQSGIGKGLFGWDDFRRVESRIHEELAACGARIDAVFACPFHPAGNPPYRHPDHPARKPNPGMLRLASRILPLDLSTSWIAGDRARDLQAGRNAGLQGGILVATGYGSSDEERALATALETGGGFQVRFAARIENALGLPLFAGRSPA